MLDLTLDSVGKLKVADLRSELTERGLDPKGVKAVLIERLQSFFKTKEGEDSIDDNSGSNSHDEIEENGKLIDEHDPEESFEKLDQMNENNVAREAEDILDEAENEQEDENNVQGDDSDENEDLDKEKDMEEAPAEDLDEESHNDEHAEDDFEKERELEPSVDVKQELNPDDESMDSKKDYEEAPMEDISEGYIKKEPETLEAKTAEVKQENVENEKMGYEQATAEVKVEIKSEEAASETKAKDRNRRDDDKRGQKRSREDHSSDFKRARQEISARTEDEPEFDQSAVVLDWYNSDMSLVIEPETRLSVEPMTNDGFGYVWHGVRGTYGYTKGRIMFELKVENHLSVPHLEAEEQHPHVMRCGWSVDEAGLTLGEEPLSWGYGGTAKASTNLKFKDYGIVYKEGDTIGCYLDMDAEPMQMSFTVNGDHQGVCYRIPHGDIGDGAMFPHLLTKNCSFKVNFGSMTWGADGVTSGPWGEALPGYVCCGQVPLEERVLGTRGPEKREDAEAIMMIGLPGCGKTTYIEKYIKENPTKKYNVLGTNCLIDRMKVMGLPRKRNYHGRWDTLIDKCTKCLNALLRLGYSRRRNFIIDQTNVYPTAQKRKIRGFEGFKRKAFVICPTDDDLKFRFDKMTKVEGKEVPERAVLEMKANFKLPDEPPNENFDEVVFIELDREESTNLVEQYNKEGEEAGFGPSRRRGGGGGGGNRGNRNFNDRRGGGERGGGFKRGGGWDRDRDRSGNFDRRDRGGWNRDSRDNRGGGGGGGGYRNRDGGNRGNFNRDNRDRSGSRDGGRRGGGGGYRDRGNRDNSYGGGNRGNSYGGGRDGGYGGGGRDGGYGGGGRDGGYGGGGRDGGRDGGYGNRDGGSWGGRSNSYGSSSGGGDRGGSGGYRDNEHGSKQSSWGGGNQSYGGGQSQNYQQSQGGYGQQNYQQSNWGNTGTAANQSWGQTQQTQQSYNPGYNNWSQQQQQQQQQQPQQQYYGNQQQMTGQTQGVAQQQSWAGYGQNYQQSTPNQTAGGYQGQSYNPGYNYNQQAASTTNQSWGNAYSTGAYGGSNPSYSK